MGQRGSEDVGITSCHECGQGIYEFSSCPVADSSSAGDEMPPEPREGQWDGVGWMMMDGNAKAKTFLTPAGVIVCWFFPPPFRVLSCSICRNELNSLLSVPV